MGKSDTLRSLISLGFLTTGVIIIVLGAIRGFGTPVFDILFQRPVEEQTVSAIIGLGTAFTFIAVWLQQKPFVTLSNVIKKALKL